jgi:hypothetical protein
MREKFQLSINFTAPGQFHLPGQHGWVGGRRAGASFFARYLDYFIVTQNSHPSPGLGTIKTIYRDKKLSSVNRDWQKTRHPDTDANSLNRRAVIRHLLQLPDLKPI